MITIHTPEFTHWKDQCKTINSTAYFRTVGEHGWHSFENIDNELTIVPQDGPCWTDAAQTGENRRYLIGKFNHNTNTGKFY